MDLVEIDVVGLKTPETRFHGVHDMSPRGANIVASRANTPENFGGDDNILARDVEVLKRLA